MEITSELLSWDSDDTHNLRLFLGTKTGGRFLPKLLEATPELLGKGESNDILIRSGEVRGCQLFARVILSMTVIPPSPAKDENPYPSPEDDKAWNDGQTLSPEPQTNNE